MTARFIITAKLKDRVAVLDLDDFIEEYYPVGVVQDLMSRNSNQFISLVPLSEEVYLCQVSILGACIAEYYAQQTHLISGKAKLAGVEALLYVVRAKDNALYAFSTSANICLVLELPIKREHRNGVVRVPTFATFFMPFSLALPYHDATYAEVKIRNGGTIPVNVHTIEDDHFAVVFLNENKCETVTLSCEMFRSFTLRDFTLGLRDTCVKNLTLDLVRANNAAFSFESAFECNSVIEKVVSSSRMTCKAKNFHCTFNGCSSLKDVNLGSMNTSIAGSSSLDFMFGGCTSLVHADLRWLDMSNVINAANMFKNCASLRTVNFQRGASLKFGLVCYDMFDGCNQLSLKGVGADANLSMIRDEAVKWIKKRDQRENNSRGN